LWIGSRQAANVRSTVVETLTDAGVARPVAEMTPLMTVKG
jgi:hypothetical protein